MALAPVVDEALKLVRATLPAMVDIRVRYAADLPPVSIDPTQIHQIIVNLATNAAHAIGGRSGHIDVAIDAVSLGADFASRTPGVREGRYVRLEVADDGCGIDRATLERIFDPFFTTKPQGVGTGLGLSVVHGIVKGHDGAINVYSEPGRGTTFRIYLPAMHAAPARPDAPLRATVGSKRPHVLLVDDERSLATLASKMLERIGYTVTAHTDATTALAEFRAHAQRFDAVVTDLEMTGMTGFDLAREVMTLRADIPIVMTSGLVRPEDQLTAASLGIRALIAKPDTVEELGYVLNRALRDRAADSTPSTQRIGDSLG
jgi:CheY-like chemotaxis protein